ncbi:MAG: histidine kinase [Bacteroidetes bacterium]|nr:histidine kinase [Bacteroidota bacterium]
MVIKIKKSKLFDILLSPYFLSLIITIPIILFLPDAFNKYEVKLTKSESVLKPNSIEEYYDLDFDGFSERVVAFPNAIGLASVQILNNDGGLIDQWNFKGEYPLIGGRFTCADLDADSLMEVYVISISNDTLYLHAFEPMNTGEIIFTNKFLSKIDLYENEIDVRIGWTEPQDIDGDRFDELIMNVHAGFSKQPRGIFVYDAQEDTINRTAPMAANINRIVCTDLNGDNKMEIFCGGSTLGNILDSLGIPYSDYSSWLFGLDHQLKLLFDPIEYDAYPSFININEIKSGEVKRIVALYKNKTNSDHASILSLIDEKGNTIRKMNIEEVGIDYNFHPTISTIEYEGKQCIMMTSDTNETLLLDSSFQVVKTIPVFAMDRILETVDMNQDGKKEFIFRHMKNRIQITDNRLKNSVVIPIKLNSFFMNPWKASIKLNGTKLPELFIKSDHSVSFYTYHANPLYYLHYPIWLGIYLIILALIILIRHIQKIQLQRKMEIENRMNALQLKTIKSQMDPHFMFNALNSISNNILQNEKDIAYKYLIKFSSLLRSLFNKADDLTITIQEELNFVQNYLELEQFRFKGGFSYEIETEPNMDLSIQVPRMLFQLFVENAIKHGIRHRKDNEGQIVISLKMNAKSIIATIEDNGIGRKEAKSHKDGHGKGLKVIDEMIALYENIAGKKVKYQYIDKKDDFGAGSGTVVNIIIEK